MKKESVYYPWEIASSPFGLIAMTKYEVGGFVERSEVPGKDEALGGELGTVPFRVSADLTVSGRDHREDASRAEPHPEHAFYT